MYFRPESVKIAIDMHDDMDFRLGRPAPNGKIGVSPADANYKAQKEHPANLEALRKGTAAHRDRQKVIKKTEEMNRYVELSTPR